MAIRPRRPALVVITAAAGALAPAPPARAQVIAHPNQIVGEVVFTNTDPAVLAILNRPGDVPPGIDRGLDSGRIESESLPPQAPQLEATSNCSAATRLSMPYQLTVESGPAGSGIAYRVNAVATLRYVGQAYASYHFASRDSAPVEYEPAPDVRLDLRECVGVIHLVVRDQNGMPVAMSGGRANAFVVGQGNPAQAWKYLTAGATEDWLVVRGGVRHRITHDVTVGSDPYWDELTFRSEQTIDVPCDGIVDLVAQVQSPGPGGPGGPPLPGLGACQGLIDVKGEDEHFRTDTTTTVRALFGPWGNRRYDVLDFVPSSGSFFLPNMMPSTVTSPATGYQLVSALSYRLGNRYSSLQPPRPLAPIEAGVTLDLGGALVIDPGYYEGDIRLAGPLPDPALGSPLDHLWRGEDANGDGLPDYGWLLGLSQLTSLVGSEGSGKVAPGARLGALFGTAGTLFEGRYDPAVSDFLGDYQLVLGGLYQEPSLWEQPTLRLYFKDLRTPAVPESYLSSRYNVLRAPGEVLVTPGGHELLPFHLCMSELRVRFTAFGGTFTDPTLTGDGRFQGIDFELNTVDQAFEDLDLHGTPVSSGTAAADGLVVTMLPQGDYVFNPFITAVNPGGGTSRTALNPIALTLGCRERREVWTDLTVSLGNYPQCVAAPTVRLDGQVTGTTPVERIEAVVNGGPPDLLCTACGVEPTFSFVAALQVGSNDIEVVVTDALGRTASLRTTVDRDTVPGPLGNVLMAVKELPNVHLSWQPAPASRATELVWDTAKAMPLPRRLAIRAVPATDVVDGGAVDPARGRLLFYRARGLNCVGYPGQ